MNVISLIKLDFLYLGVFFLWNGYFLFVHQSSSPQLGYGGGIVLAILGIPVLLYSRNQSSRQLKGFLQYMTKFKNSLAGTNDQIYGSCQQLDETTEQQSSAVLETGAASDEISAMISRSAENIRNVESSAQSIKEIIKASAESSSQLEGSLNQSTQANKLVVELIESTSGMLEDLSELFKDVVNKTAVINDIVFQTKLLSFNASVEAARAGEHGKGFAVVAEEIGNLATMSGESANAIQETLETTDKKVKTILDTIEKSSSGLSKTLTQQTDTFQEILTQFENDFSKASQGVQEIAQQISEVSTAAQEQSRGVEEMRGAIHQVSESIQQNTLVVSQTANLSEVLNKEFSDLHTHLNEIGLSFGNDLVGLLDEIPWDEKYMLGIPQVDTEHQTLVARINDLIRAMNGGNMKEIQHCFQELAQFTVYHFGNEETFMKRIGYRSLESHKKVHKNLLASVTEFGQKLEKGQLDSAKLASFLKNWLFTHIMGVDAKYAAESHRLGRAA